MASTAARIESSSPASISGVSNSEPLTRINSWLDARLPSAALSSTAAATTTIVTAIARPSVMAARAAPERAW
jgi:hypothetical protein